MNTELLFIVAETLEVLGAILIAYMAINVHRRVWQEHRIDKHVFDEMKKEQLLGVVGIALIVTGYLLNASIRLFLN